MSREDDIVNDIAEMQLEFDDNDCELANYVDRMAKQNLLGRGEPSISAIEFVVDAALNAGRLMGGARAI